MKKIISTITILSFLMQVIPFEVKAQPVYDDVFDSGDIFIAADGVEGGTPQMVRYDGDNGYSSSTLATPPAGIAFGYSLFLPNGDLVIPAFDVAPPNLFRPYLFCKTVASDYASDCSWSGVDGYDLGATAALVAEVPVSGRVDQYGQIWTVHHEGSDGQYVARTNLDSGTPVVTTYHMVPASGATTARPLGIAFDHLGDVWITSYWNTTGPALGDRVFCLDRSNNYAACTGSVFAADGSIVLGTALAIPDVEVDSNNDIFTVQIATGGNAALPTLKKIDRDQNFAVSTVSLGSILPFYMALDFNDIDNVTDDWLWIHYKTEDTAAGGEIEVQCFKASDLTPCLSGGATDLSYVGTGFDAGRMFIDQNRKVYALNQNNGGTGRVYCWAPNNIVTPTSYSACALANKTASTISFASGSNTISDSGNGFVTAGFNVGGKITVTGSGSNNGNYTISSVSAGSIVVSSSLTNESAGASVTISTTADAEGAKYLTVDNLGDPYGTNNGDPTGAKINFIMEVAAGQDTAQITATVDPVISVSFRTTADDGPLVDNLCALGNISDGTVKTCGYRIAIDTNATNGFSISADANGGLISGSDEIDAIAENSTVSANTEGYGIAVTKPADTAGTTFTEVGDFSDDDTPVPNAITQVVTSDGPIDWTAATLNTSTLITHRVAVSPVTPAGSYSQIITYTITGNF